MLDTPGAGPAALRGGALRAGGYAAGIALSLASAPILIHHLGVAGFGRYTTVVALVALIGTGTEAGLNAIALREYSTHEGEARRLVMRHLLGIRLALTGVGVAAATLFALAAGYDNVLVLGTVAAGTGLVLTTVQTLLAVPLQAGLRFGWATALDLFRQAITVALIIALAVAGAALLPFFVVPVVAGLAALAATIAVVRRSIPLKPTLSPRAWAPLVRATLPFAVATAVYAAYFRVAIIVMSIASTPVETGYFATSYRVIEVLISVPAVAVTAAFPILARSQARDSERFERATVRMIELALIAGAATALGLVLAAPWIVDFLAPASGRPAVPVLRIQGAAMFATFVSVAGVFPLLSLHRERAILTANAVAFCAAVALTLALVPAHAARGAAVATTIAEFLLAAVTVLLLRREVPAIGRAARAAPAVALAAAAGLAVLLVPGLPSVVDTVAGLSVYALVLLAFGRFPAEVREALTRARP